MKKKFTYLLMAVILIAVSLIISRPSYGGNAPRKQIFIIYADGKYGFIDGNGAVIIKPTFDQVMNNDFNLNYYEPARDLFFQNGLEAVKTDKKWGLINSSGKTIIKPQYDEIKLFYGSTYIVKQNSKYGVVDLKGKQIVPFGKYDSIRPVVNGYAGVTKKNAIGFVDIKGNEVIHLKFWGKKYSSVGDFHEGLARIYAGEDEEPVSTGYINQKGKLVFEQVSDASDFTDGLASISYYDENEISKFEFIDKSNKVVSSFKDVYFLCKDYGDGFVAYVNRYDNNNYVGILNKKGNVVLKPVYENIIRTKDGKFLCISSTGLLTLCSSTGKELYKFKGAVALSKNYGFNEFLQEGPISAKINNGKETFTGYVDLKNKKAIKPQVNAVDLGCFSEGLAWYKASNGKYGILNLDGKEVVKASYNKIYNYSHGLARFELQENGKTVMGYLNTKGKIIFNTRSVLKTSDTKNTSAKNVCNNMSNLGFMAESNDWIYYNDDGQLCKKKIGSITKTKLSNDNCRYINVSGDWIYYMVVSDSEQAEHAEWPLCEIYKIKKDGTSRTRLLRGAYDKMYVEGNYMYYLDIKQAYFGLIRMDITTKKTEMIIDDCSNFNSFSVDSENFYYISNVGDDRDIYKINKNGGNKTILYWESSYKSYIEEDGEWIYFIENSNDNSGTLVKVSKIGTGKIAVCSDISEYNVSNGIVYYIDSVGQLYKINSDGSDKKLISSKRTGNIYIIGDWVYFYQWDDKTQKNRIFRVRKNGSGMQAVS